MLTVCIPAYPGMNYKTIVDQDWEGCTVLLDSRLESVKKILSEKNVQISEYTSDAKQLVIKDFITHIGTKRCYILHDKESWSSDFLSGLVYEAGLLDHDQQLVIQGFMFADGDLRHFSSWCKKPEPKSILTSLISEYAYASPLISYVFDTSVLHDYAIDFSLGSEVVLLKRAQFVIDYLMGLYVSHSYDEVRYVYTTGQCMTGSRVHATPSEREEIKQYMRGKFEVFKHNPWSSLYWKSMMHQ